ncbi:MAG: DNA-3-methyladenine glycosylase [Planctomycetota bacterium]|jgi:DNA-3-methyladenine glycosylase
MTPRFNAFFHDPVRVARRLLGQRLVRVLDRRRLAGIIVEVEAYLGPPDKAAHTYGGRRTARNASMYLAGGHAYVYFTYGMHHCLNVVCGEAGDGVAVLVRALEPTEGLQAMFAHRPKARRASDLCSGPAKLTQALSVGRGLDGVDLRTSRSLFIEQLRRCPLAAGRIVAGPRVGVQYAGEWAHRPLRFHIKDNPHVSR